MCGIVTAWNLNWWADALLIFPACWSALQFLLAEWAAIRASHLSRTLSQDELNGLNATPDSTDNWTQPSEAVLRVSELRALSQRRMAFSSLLPRSVLWLLFFGLVLQIATLVC